MADASGNTRNGKQGRGGACAALDVFMRHIMAVIKLATFLLWTAILIVPHIVLFLSCRNMVLAHLYHRVCCRIFGLIPRFFVQNDDTAEYVPCRNMAGLMELTARRQTVFLSNHVSYLDIIVMGGVFPASFVAKSDVANWPLFGFLAKLQDTVFVPRKASAFSKARDMIADRLTRGESLIFFPEGTSTDGRGIAPLKSSMFALFSEAAQQNHISLRPVTICLKSVEGDAALEEHFYGAKRRDFYAWYGDMTLVPHLWRLAQLRCISVDVYIHGEIKADVNTDRKTLSKIVAKIIRSKLPS